MVQEEEDGRVLVFSHDYQSGADFDVVSQLETSTTVEVLQDEGEPIPEISQPDNYTGHIIRYASANGSQTPTTLLFLRGESLDSGDSGTLGEDASMFSTQLNLLVTTLD